MQTPFSFVHAADLHLGAPFAGLGELSPKTANLLRDATLDAYDKLVDLAIGSGARFLLLAGDVYDGPEVSIRPLVRFLDGVKRLEKVGVEVFLAAGNHDPRDGRVWSALGPLPANLKIFPAQPASYRVFHGDELLAVVHGISYPKREVAEDLSAKLSRLAEDVFQVGVVHATIGPAGGHLPYAPANLETLKASGLDCWALGHVHTRAVINPAHPLVLYPGNIQGLSPRETGPRGAYVVQVDADGLAVPRFHDLDLVRFESVDVGLCGLETAGGAVEKLRAAAEALLRGSNGRPLVVRAALTGESPLFAELSSSENIGELLSLLRSEFMEGEPLLWWDAIENRVMPPLNLGALTQRGGLEAQVIAEASALEADPALLSATLSEVWSPLYSKREYAKLLGDISEGGDRMEELLAARNLALTLLLKEGR